MIKIAICDNNANETIELRNTIRDHLLHKKIVVKMDIFDSPEKLLESELIHDIYLVDDNDQIENIKKYSDQIREKAPNCHLAYMSDTPNHAHEAFKIHADAYLIKPITIEDLDDALSHLLKNFRLEHVIIKTGDGERRILATDLNYINIVKRCLCYHIVDGSMFDSYTLRSSFKAAITPLEEHPMFLYIEPSSLMNVANVREIKKDYVVFNDDNTMLYPDKYREEIKRRCRVFNNTIN